MAIDMKATGAEDVVWDLSACAGVDDPTIEANIQRNERGRLLCHILWQPTTLR
jgi:hypothetical protein